MVIWALYELEFFALFWDWYDLRLTISVYACLVLGFVLELILSGRRKKVCRLLPLLCVGGMVVCELLWHVLDGLNKLLAAIACGGVACMLLGALLAVVVLRVRRKNAVSAAGSGE